ncbi:MAG: nodulation protein NfeD [Nitriliruptorales bacterium]
MTFPARLRGLLSLLALVLLLSGGAAVPALAALPAPAEPAVEILQVSGLLDPPVLAAVRDLVERAEERGSEAVVLQLDGPGAVDVAPHEVVEAIRSQVPVVVWIGPGNAQAAGAALFLLMASDLPAASSTASIGPACPVTATRYCDPQDLGLLAALLRERGQSEDNADLVADPLVSDVAAAADLAAGGDGGVVELVVDGLEALLVDLDGRSLETDAGSRTLKVNPQEVTVRFHNLGLLRRALHAVLDPAVLYFLLVGVLLLAAFEVFQPGFGVAGVAAVLLSPLTLYGLVVFPVRWWALGLIGIGVLALALDLAIAGLGVPTAAGALALTIGSLRLFAGDSPWLRLSPWLVGAVVAVVVVYFVIIMTVVLRAQAGPDPSAIGEDLAGRVGMVRSALNPEGHVFVAGALWRARWIGEETGRIKAGTEVRVAGLDGAVLLVDAVEPAALLGSEARPPGDGNLTPDS